LSLPLVLTENARGIVFAISINDALDSSHLLEPLKLPTTDTCVLAKLTKDCRVQRHWSLG